MLNFSIQFNTAFRSRRLHVRGRSWDTNAYREATEAAVRGRISSLGADHHSRLPATKVSGASDPQSDTHHDKARRASASAAEKDAVPTLIINFGNHVTWIQNQCFYVQNGGWYKYVFLRKIWDDNYSSLFLLLVSNVFFYLYKNKIT